MAYKKLDSKQVPQVVILGALCVAVLAYVAFQLFGSQASASAERPTVGVPGAAAAQVPPAAGSGSLTPPSSAGSLTPVAAQPAGDGAVVPPGLGFPKGYNPDPFRSLVRTDAPVVIRPSVREPRAFPSWPSGPSLPGPEEAHQPAAPVPPPAPERPEVAVTGIIDVQDGADMALIEAGTEQRIVQVGDLVSEYRVKKIGMDGIWLGRGADRFFVALNAVESLQGRS